MCDATICVGRTSEKVLIVVGVSVLELAWAVEQVSELCSGKEEFTCQSTLSNLFPFQNVVLFVA